MQRGWWYGLTVCVVVASLLGGGLATDGMAMATHDASPAAHRFPPNAEQESCLRKSCVDCPQKAHCGSCFRSIDKEFGIIPPEIVFRGSHPLSVAAPVSRVIEARTDRSNHIRAPPA